MSQWNVTWWHGGYTSRAAERLCCLRTAATTRRRKKPWRRLGGWEGPREGLVLTAAPTELRRFLGVNGGCAVCMEAPVRELPRCFAVFVLQPPWGDTTNHGGGWVVGETHREGFILTEMPQMALATCGNRSD